MTTAARVARKAGPQYSNVYMTPTMARKLLDSNRKNRVLRPNKVDALVRDILTDKWADNGETIKVSKDGLLMDGQHRLMAIVKSNRTVPVTLVTNLDEDVRGTIDTGTKRQFADQLRMKEVKNASTVSAIARRLVMWENGYYFSNAGTFVPTEAEMDMFIEKHPDIHEASDMASTGRRGIKISPVNFGLSFYFFNKIDPVLARSFFVKLIDGVDLAYGDPVFALRKRIIDELSIKRSKLPNGGRSNDAEVLAYIIHAWNLTRKNRRVNRLNPPRGGWSRDNFPMPI